MLTWQIIRRCTAAITLSIGLSANTAFAADDIIKIGYRAAPQQYNPAYANSRSTTFVLRNVYDTLIREGNLTGFTGGLAERWNVSDDATVYEFWFRDDARWSDGTLIDAAYAAESFRLLGSLPESINFIDFSEIEISVEQDNYGEDFLRFELPEPSSQFFSFLTHISNAVLPVHKAEEVDFSGRWESFDDSIKLYSGPYVLLNVDAGGKHFTLRPNPGYHSPNDVKNAGIDMVSLEDQDLKAIAALRSGELHMVPHRASGQSTFLNEAMQDYIRKIEYPAIEMLRVNSDRPALQDPAVRRAIAQVSRLSEETSFVEENNLHIAGSLIPTQLQTSLGYPEEANDYPGDAAAIEAARTAMRELGYGPLNQLEIDFAVNASVLHERMANLMRARLKQIYIDATIVVQPWDDHLEMLNRADYDIARFGWAYDIAHPNNLLKIFTTGKALNYDGYSNPDYDRIVAAMDKAFDSEALAALVADAEAILSRDVPSIPLYQRNDYLLVNPKLILGEYNFAGHLRFDQIHWSEPLESQDQS